jgi:hypothetical protein
MNTEKNSNMERQLTLTIGGPDVEDTKILFSVLAGKMDWLQKTLFNISLTESSDLVAQRGNWSKCIRASCEPLFCESRKGSVKVVAEKPPPLSVQTTLLDKEIDEGLHTLNNTKWK